MSDNGFNRTRPTCLIAPHPAAARNHEGNGARAVEDRARKVTAAEGRNGAGEDPRPTRASIGRLPVLAACAQRTIGAQRLEQSV